MPLENGLFVAQCVMGLRGEMVFCQQFIYVEIRKEKVV